MRHFLLIAILIINGCSYHPQELSSPPAMPASFGENSSTGNLQPDHWWQSLGDMKLNRFMEDALKNNHGLQQTAARIRQAQALHQQAKATSLPWLNLELSAGRSLQPVMGVSSTGSNHQINLAANYEIDIWQRLKHGRQAAFLQVGSFRAAEKAIKLTLSALIAETWFHLAELNEQLDLNQAIISSRRQNLAKIHTRYRAGLIPSLDLFQARQALSEAESTRPDLLASRKVSRHALNLLAGKWPDHQIDEPETLIISKDNYQPGLPSQVINKRPDVKAAFFELKAADHDIAFAMAAKLPAFSLTGAGGGSSDELTRILASPSLFWNIMATASHSLFNHKSKQAEVERRKAIFDEKLSLWHEKIITAFHEVANCLARQQAADQSLKEKKKLAAATKATLLTANRRYDQGLSSYLEVLAAETAHARSRQGVIAGQMHLVSSRVSLARALGGD